MFILENQYVQDEGGFPGHLLGFAHQRAGSQEGQGKLSTGQPALN
jgi:hypothetical protein